MGGWLEYIPLVLEIASKYFFLILLLVGTRHPRVAKFKLIVGKTQKAGANHVLHTDSGQRSGRGDSPGMRR